RLPSTHYAAKRTLRAGAERACAGPGARARGEGQGRGQGRGRGSRARERGAGGHELFLLLLLVDPFLLVFSLLAQYFFLQGALYTQEAQPAADMGAARIALGHGVCWPWLPLRDRSRNHWA